MVVIRAHRVLSTCILLLCALPQSVCAQVITTPPSGVAKPELLTADEHWAKAVWLSTFSNGKDYTAEVAASFAAALARTENKAPICVSAGHAAAGPSQIQKRFQKILKQVEQDVTEEPAATRFTEELAETEKVLGGELDSATAQYLAAIGEDPTYLPAWYQLALHSDGDLFNQAIAGFIKHDPDNALPHYVLGMRQCQAGDYAAAVTSIQTGNQESVCRWYPPPLPRRCRLVYPDDELFRTHGVTGKPIPYTVFVLLLERTRKNFEWTNPLNGMLYAAYDLRKHARRLLETGDRDKAVAILLAVREQGLQLMAITPPDANRVIEGRAITKIPYADLSAQLAAHGPKSALESLEQTHAREQQFDKVFMPFIDQYDARDIDLRQVLTGELDLLGTEQKQLEDILRQTGFFVRPPVEAARPDQP